MKKLSGKLISRLKGLGSSKHIRVVILLEVGRGEVAHRRVRAQEERVRRAEETRARASAGLDGVDQVLQRFGGARGAARPDLLGSVPVETTAAGVKALAALPNVKAILEDQRIQAATT